MILVLGGGFGLYGHLAALARTARPLATLSAYRTIIEARPELRFLAGRVEWIDDETEAFDRATTVVLARRPADNTVLARKLVERGTGGVLAIEKPIAPSPEEALDLGRMLDAKERRWATPYLFLYCGWFDVMRDRFANDARAKLELHWSFRRSPRSGGWKSAADEGGGALAFYFIQLIAVAQSLLPRAAREWSRFTGDGGETLILNSVDHDRSLSIRFDLDRSPLSFTVRDGASLLAEETTPFGAAPAAGTSDPRIPSLCRFYEEALFGGEIATELNRGVHEIWRDMDRT